MSTKVLLAAAAVLPLLAIADRPASTTHAQQLPPSPTAAPPAISDAARARLDEIRRTLVAQIAVIDGAEQSFRAPTPAESAALNGPSGDAVEAQGLPGGGLALRTSAEQLSLAVATVAADGTVQVSHGGAAAQTGGPDAR